MFWGLLCKLRDALCVYSLGGEGGAQCQLIALDQLGMEYAGGCGPLETIHGYYVIDVRSHVHLLAPASALHHTPTVPSLDPKWNESNITAHSLHLP